VDIGGIGIEIDVLEEGVEFRSFGGLAIFFFENDLVAAFAPVSMLVVSAIMLDPIDKEKA
jgi:hypothetical protein